MFHEGRPAHQATCIWFCSGSLLHDAELDRVADFLDERYKESDHGVMNPQGFPIREIESGNDAIPTSVRFAALTVLAKAGEKAKRELPRLYELAKAHPTSFPLDSDGKPITTKSPDVMADWVSRTIREIESK
jgi:hypothetical protein